MSAISTSPYRSARIHATGAIILLCISSIIAAVSMLVAYDEIDLVRRAESGERLSTLMLQEHESRAVMVNGAFALAWFATATIYIVWMYRTLKNLEGMGVNPEYSPKDAIIWWFVPLLWYWRPYQVMHEIWAGSHPANYRPRLLLVWWVSWVVGGTLSWLSLISGEDTLSQLYWGNLMAIGANGVTIIAGILAIAAVWQITSAQGQKHTRLRAK